MKKIRYILLLSAILIFNILTIQAYEVGVDYPDVHMPHGYWYYMTTTWKWKSTEPDYSKTPVILVPGWRNDAEFMMTYPDGDWGYFEKYLREQNYDIWKLYYWPANLSNRKNAGMVGNAIEEILNKGYKENGINKVDIISHSVGGLGVMGYIHDMAINPDGSEIPYHDNIRKFVMISPPLYGSYFANIVDGISGIDVKNGHPYCYKLINGENIVLWYDGPNLRGNSEATLDMEIGSDFTWELNNKNLNKDVDYMTIAGTGLLEDIYDNYIFRYCMSNHLEPNDGVVSIVNSYLLDKGYPLIVLDKFHTKIHKYTSSAKVSDLFLNNKLNKSNVDSILNNNEFYYETLLDTHTEKGGVIIDIKSSEIDVNNVSLFNPSGIYPLEKNTETSKWFYIDKSGISDRPPGGYKGTMEFTTLLPFGDYNIGINNQEYNELSIDILKVNLYPINLDSDFDDFDTDKVGGSDCNDDDNLINPDADERCNNLDDDCDVDIDEDLTNQTGLTDIGICEFGLDECQSGEWIEIISPIFPSEEICDNLDNDCDGTTDEDLINLTDNQLGLCESNSKYCETGEWIDSGDNYQPVEEICEDELDNDCDGEIDEGCEPLCTLHSPINNEVYPSRRISFNIQAIEKLAEIEYKDDSGRWRRLCRNCDEYDREKSFREGEHDLIIKCTDYLGESEEHPITFTNDYVKPRISRTSPRKNSFTNGSGFYIKFKEENPVSVSVTYNPTIPIDLEDCADDGRYKECYVNLDLDEYDGEEIEYSFSVEDIAGNTATSRLTEVKVDTTPPELNNPDDFWHRGEGRYSNYIYFNMDITEDNLDEVSYVYIDGRGKEREKRLCSRLNGGKCEKRRRLARGETPLKVIISDKAGNKAEYPVELIF